MKFFNSYRTNQKALNVSGFHAGAVWTFEKVRFAFYSCPKSKTFFKTSYTSFQSPCDSVARLATSVLRYGGGRTNVEQLCFIQLMC